MEIQKKKWDSETCFKVGKTLATFHKVNKSFKLKIKENDFSITYWKKLFLILKNKKNFKK